MSGLCSECTFYSAYFVFRTECLPSATSSPRVVDSSRAGVRTGRTAKCGQRQARAAGDSSLVPLRLLPLLPQVSEALWLVPSASPPGGGCADVLAALFLIPEPASGVIHHGGWHAISLIFPAYPRQRSESTTA